MRIEADLTDADRKAAENWADKHGFTMPKAYGELIRIGTGRSIKVGRA